MAGVGCLLMVSVLLCIAQGSKGDSDAYQDEHDLRASLFEGYDKTTFPGKNITVTLYSMEVLHLDMDEANHVAEVSAWLHMFWSDPRLVWNPEDHGSIDRLAVDPDSIWKPDMSVYNGHRGENSNLEGSHLPVALMANRAVYVPALTLRFSCIMDLTYWPHDKHTCTVTIGSWVHHEDQIDIDAKNFTIKLGVLREREAASGQNISQLDWKVEETSSKRRSKVYDCCPSENYATVLISLTVSRTGHVYAWTIKVPAVCLCLLSIVVFLLPPSAGEKVVLGGICLLMDLLFLFFATYTIGNASSHAPLIVQLVSQQLVMVMVSIIVSALIVRTSRIPHGSGLPAPLRKMVLALSQLLCLSNYSRTTSGSHQNLAMKSEEVELGEGSSSDIRRRDNVEKAEWVLLAALLDRVFLVLYLCICIITLIRFCSVL